MSFVEVEEEVGYKKKWNFDYASREKGTVNKGTVNNCSGMGSGGVLSVNH